MIETNYQFTRTDSKKIEQILEDGRIAINHMVLPNGDSLPLHYANSNVYMTVVRGTISMCLDDQEQHDYPAGSLLVIPLKTRMNIFNSHEEIAEIFVVKSPSPKSIAEG